MHQNEVPPAAQTFLVLPSPAHAVKGKETDPRQKLRSEKKSGRASLQRDALL